MLKFFYGLRVPKGTVYMLKPNGKKVDKLAACKKIGERLHHPVRRGPRGDRRDGRP